MKAIKTAIFIFILFFLIVYFSMFFYWRSNIKELHLTDYNDIEVIASLFNKKIIPKDAYAINISSGVDPSFFRIEFNYKDELTMNDDWEEVKFEVDKLNRASIQLEEYRNKYSYVFHSNSACIYSNSCYFLLDNNKKQGLYID